MKRKVLWFFVVIVIWATVHVISVLYGQCMTSCVAEFKGAYPDVACKYECSFFNKFKKPTKRP
jgi:hypothetical protein